MGSIGQGSEDRETTRRWEEAKKETEERQGKESKKETEEWERAKEQTEGEPEE